MNGQLISNLRIGYRIHSVPMQMTYSAIVDEKNEVIGYIPAPFADIKVNTTVVRGTINTKYIFPTATAISKHYAILKKKAEEKR